MNYVATFFTHLAALRTQRSLTAQGVSARMAPVPRALSSSCGTCVLYAGEQPHLACMDRDTEGVYCQTETGYQPIEWGKEKP